MEAAALPGLGLKDDGPGPVYVECDYLAVRRGEDKLITARGKPLSDEVYDLSTDPAERRDLGDRDEAALESLRALAKNHWERSPSKDAGPTLPEIDDDTKERLRALGYLE
jgi:hypothetical protein